MDKTLVRCLLRACFRDIRASRIRRARALRWARYIGRRTS